MPFFILAAALDGMGDVGSEESQDAWYVEFSIPLTFGALTFLMKFAEDCIFFTSFPQ